MPNAKPNPKDVVAIGVKFLHDALFKLSKGRIGRSVMGMPVVFLTTTGRKSGQPRRTPLTVPVQDGDRLVLVASYGGDDRHPAWYLNLVADPDVTVDRGDGDEPMRARVATTQEKADLWPRVIARYKGYADYQTRTSRDIPLVLLEPR